MVGFTRKDEICDELSNVFKSQFKLKGVFNKRVDRVCVKKLFKEKLFGVGNKLVLRYFEIVANGGTCSRWVKLVSRRDETG